MGHICVDATNTIPRTYNRAPNSQIPGPSTQSWLDENLPPIYYRSAFTQWLTWIYNVWVDHPTNDILIMPNDIISIPPAVLYHLCFMPVFMSLAPTYVSTQVPFWGGTSIEVPFSCRSLDFCLGLIFAWYRSFDVFFNCLYNLTCNIFFLCKYLVQGASYI